MCTFTRSLWLTCLCCGLSHRHSSHLLMAGLSHSKMWRLIERCEYVSVMKLADTHASFMFDFRSSCSSFIRLSRRRLKVLWWFTWMPLSQMQQRLHGRFFAYLPHCWHILTFVTSDQWWRGTVVERRRTFPVLCSTCSWWVTTYVGEPSTSGHPTRPI